MEFCTDDILFPLLPDASKCHHFFVMRLLRGLASGRSLCDEVVPIENRLLAAAGAPKLKAGLGVTLVPHCDAPKLNDGTDELLAAPNLNSPEAATLGWAAALLEMPLLKPLVEAPNAFCAAPNWNPPG